jgi:integrase/recombinase XerD
MKKDLSQLFDEFIFECEFARKLRPQTLIGYKEAISLFLKLTPDASVESLSVYMVSNFFKVLEQRKRIVGKGLVKVGIKRSTVANYWSKYNCFFDWLKNHKYITENPLAQMAYPAPTYEDKKFLKKEEIEKILTAIITHCDENSLILKRNLVMFYILLFCGLRRQELLLLQVRDIDIERRILTVRAETSKIPRTRYIPLHSQTIFHLKNYLIERKKYSTPYLIVSNNIDDRLGQGGLKKLLDKLRIHSGVRFHMHQFRHTFAVNFLKQSNNIAKLKQLMGHTDIRMTLQYLRCLPTSEMRRDIEVMSIDNLV